MVTRSILRPVLRPVTRAVSDTIRGFNPRSLFASGEQGIWLDPSDFSTLFQDAAGTTPVTAVGQPVGLALDKRLGLALGTEIVTNGNFDNDDGWVLQPEVTISGGSLNFNSTATRTATATGASCVSGRWYVVEFDLTYTSGTARFNAGGGTTNITSSTGHKRYIRQATGTNDFYFSCSSAGAVYSVDNVTVREIAGNHAYQTTSASRPTVEARVNLATATEGAAATWNILAQVVDAGTPISGFSTSLQFGDNATARTAYKTVPMVAGVTYTASVFIEMDDGLAPSPSTLTLSGDFRLICAGTGAGGILQTTLVSGAIYRVSATITASSTANLNCGVTKATSQSSRTFRIAGIQVEEGTAATTYQRVNTATDYADVGAPRYLSFDGTDDGMATPSINFTGTDKMTVWTGVRKLSDATAAAFVELSANESANVGSFVLYAPSSALNNYRFGSRGSAAIVLANATGYVSPVSSIIAGVGDIAGDVSRIRVNGAVIQTTTTDQGTGNYGNYPLYFGARAGTSLRFSGEVFSPEVIRGAESNDAQINLVERIINKNIGGVY